MRSVAVCVALAVLGLPVAGARARVYYIDTSAPGNTRGSGTLENPYRSWKHVSFSSGNTYLQRRGTVDEVEGLFLGMGAEDVTVGAYGQGPRPKVVCSTKRYAVNGGRCTNVTVRDLEIEAKGATSCVTFGASTNVTIDNCVVHGATWGIRFTNAPSSGHKVLRTEVYDIGDDGMFIQDTTDIEIAHCHVHHVNTRWVEPYTPQTKASGDAIQLSRCNRWHVHHCTLDRTNSGNKFCFISNGEEQTQGVFERNVLSGPLTTGDGGSSIYFGSGSNLVVRHNLIKGPTPGGVYHHSSNLKVYGNVFADVSGGVTSLTDSPCEVYDNILYKIKGFLRGNNDARNNRSLTPTAELYRSMGLPGYEPLEPQGGRAAKKPRPHVPPRKPRKTVKPEALAEWDARLLARLKEEVSAGRTVEFSLQAFQQRVEVAALRRAQDGALGDVLRVKSAVAEADMDWSRLTFADRRSLASALLREGVPEDHGTLAFYLTAEGNEDGARDHLARAGDLSAAVEAAFAVVNGKDTGEAPQRNDYPPRAGEPRSLLAEASLPAERQDTEDTEGHGDRPSGRSLENPSALLRRSPYLHAEADLARCYRDAEGAFIEGDVDRARKLFEAIVAGHAGTELAKKAKEFLDILH